MKKKFFRFSCGQQIDTNTIFTQSKDQRGLTEQNILMKTKIISICTYHNMSTVHKAYNKNFDMSINFIINIAEKLNFNVTYWIHTYS